MSQNLLAFNMSNNSEQILTNKNEAGFIGKRSRLHWLMKQASIAIEAGFIFRCNIFRLKIPPSSHIEKAIISHSPTQTANHKGTTYKTEKFIL